MVERVACMRGAQDALADGPLFCGSCGHTRAAELREEAEEAAQKKEEEAEAAARQEEGEAEPKAAAKEAEEEVGELELVLIGTVQRALLRAAALCVARLQQYFEDPYEVLLRAPEQLFVTRPTVMYGDGMVVLEADLLAERVQKMETFDVGFSGLLEPLEVPASSGASAEAEEESFAERVRRSFEAALEGKTYLLWSPPFGPEEDKVGGAGARRRGHGCLWWRWLRWVADGLSVCFVVCSRSRWRRRATRSGSRTRWPRYVAWLRSHVTVVGR